MRRKWIFIAPLAILGMVVFAFVGAEVVMLLWNWLVPSLFGLRTITFWQGLGILALCRILFGRMGFRQHYRSNFRRHMSERWQKMTPEEREKFRHGMRGRCGDFGDSATETKA